MGILTDLLNPVVRTGRGLASGIGAAGRDVWGQMSGSTGPTNSRWQNIIANEANPLGMLQTGSAFASGFRDGYGGSQMPSGTFDRTQGSISSRAASGTAPAGSVVGRGFVGDGRGGQLGPMPSAPPAPRDAFGRTLGGLMSQPSQGQYQMRGTNAGPRLDAFGNTLDETLAANAGSPAAPPSQGNGQAGRRAALGAGQLGSGGAAFLSDHMRSIFNRGGTTQEQ